MIIGRIKRELQSVSRVGDPWKVSFLERNGEEYLLLADMEFVLTHEKAKAFEGFYLFIMHVTVSKGAPALCGDMLRLIGKYLFPSKYVWRTSFHISLQNYPQRPPKFLLLRSPAEEPVQISSLFNIQGELIFVVDQPSQLSLTDYLKKVVDSAEHYDE
jgi:hypothetical protein